MLRRLRRRLDLNFLDRQVGVHVGDAPYRLRQRLHIPARIQVCEGPGQDHY